MIKKYILVVLTSILSGSIAHAQSLVGYPVNFTNAICNLDSNTWNYIAITKGSNNEGKLYKNGQLVYSGSWQNISYTWSRLDLGAVFYSNYGGWFNGQIDEMRVSNIVRTSTEILSHFTSNTPFILDTNTIGLWHFDDSNTSVLSATAGANGSGLNTSSATGKYGNSFSFNGINSRVQINQSLPTSSMTLEFWIKPQGNNNDAWAVSTYGVNTSGFAISQTNNNCLAPTGNLSNGLIAYYPFCGNANDVSVNNNNGVSTNVTWGTDRFGNTNSTAEFNGDSSRYFSVTNPLNFSGTKKTFSVWIKFPINLSPGLYYNNIFSGGNFWFQIYGNYPSYISNGYTYKLGFNGTNTFISNFLFNTNTWQHIVYTVDGDLGQINLYLNGNYIGVQSISNFSTNDWSLYYIGSTPNLNSQNIFAGQIDDFGIWNRILTAQEITDLYNNNLETYNFTNNINEIKIYPNPSSSNINIDLGNNFNNNPFYIKILNALGQEVYNETINQQSLTVSSSLWSAKGVYIVQFINSQGKIVDVKKIIIK